jgi:hypothetical protein
MFKKITRDMCILNDNTWQPDPAGRTLKMEPRGIKAQANIFVTSSFIFKT